MEHAHRLRCKDTPTHSYALWYTPWHALEHTRTFRHKYDLPLHTTNRTQNQFRAGRCGQATGASTALEHLAVVTTILRLLL